ncbi:MAG: universal stress protein [Verrucomicrobia bacterium]|nr:universal stress protein [Verrucomicrobiota bacterium]
MKTTLPPRRGIRPRAAQRVPAASLDTGTGPVIDLVPSYLKLASILVPIDFSDTSQKALKYAVPFATQFGAKLTLLHVMEPVATPDFAYFPLQMENEKVMKALKIKLEMVRRKAGVSRDLVERVVVRQGTAFHEITEAARSLKCDLVILTTHGHTGVKHALLGSTAERVVRHAPCPVLVVREVEHEFV